MKQARATEASARVEQIESGGYNQVVMSPIEQEIAAYEKMRPELEANHMGKWVLFHNQKMIAIYESFEKISEDAVKRFGRGPYLIRQIGSSSVTLPASVMYTPLHA